MPYIVKKGKNSREFLIVKQKTGEVVGRSTTMKKAYASIAHREKGEAKKNRA